MLLVTNFLTGIFVKSYGVMNPKSELISNILHLILITFMPFQIIFSRKFIQQELFTKIPVRKFVTNSMKLTFVCYSTRLDQFEQDLTNFKTILF